MVHLERNQLKHKVQNRSM